MTPETLELRLPQVTLSALAWGPADGPLVVALHGFPDTAHAWRHLGPFLAGHGYRVVAPYLRGYAPSAVPDDGCFHVAALMADAAAVHEVLGGGEDAVLVGHDWGAITAHGLGAHPRSPYRRIVAMAVPPLPTMDGAGPRLLARQARNSWYVGFNQLPLLPERTLPRLVRRLWRDWSPGHDASEDLPHVLAALDAPANRHAAVGYYRAIRAPWAVPPAYRDWKRTWAGTPTVPTLYLHGADDGCLHPGFAAGVEAKLPLGSRAVTVPGAGHFLQVEQPDAVHAHVLEFLTNGP
ncbi:alpha/beta fold hydrolase [Nocardioides dongkuii]|uniref:alpha/beta fold hydrolase n=1 Tax=Nocardioides dongkuii TaxID=2760089 RepID=UPI0015FB885A|nr:alpha/beta hydrolase [Nocardioides dongkuii]